MLLVYIAHVVGTCKNRFENGKEKNNPQTVFFKATYVPAAEMLKY